MNFIYNNKSQFHLQQVSISCTKKCLRLEESTKTHTHTHTHIYICMCMYHINVHTWMTHSTPSKCRFLPQKGVFLHGFVLFCKRMNTHINMHIRYRAEQAYIREKVFSYIRLKCLFVIREKCLFIHAWKCLFVHAWKLSLRTFLKCDYNA